MKIKTFFCRILLVSLLVTMSCIDADSLKKILKDFSTATEKLADNIATADKAGDKKAIGNALKKYEANLGKLVTRFKNLKFENTKNKEIEVDFDAARAEFEKIAKQIANLVVKLTKYIMDSEIMDALKGVQEKVGEFF